MSKKNKKREQEVVEAVYHKKLIKRRKPNRSIAGDFFLYLFLFLVAAVMFFPVVFAVSNALKPLDELFKFPPKILAQNPTLDNFSDLFVTMALCGYPSTDYAARTIVTHLFDYGFTRFEMGYACSIATILFLMMILCNKAIQSLLRRVGT